MATKEFGPRKRLKKALDRLAYTWAAGALPDAARWMLESPLVWLSKERNGQEIGGSDDAWMMDALEDEILAETNERGVVMRSVDEVEAILEQVGPSARAILVNETIGEEVARLAPACADEVLRELQTVSLREIAVCLTDSEALALRVASLSQLVEDGIPSARPAADEANLLPKRPKVRPIQMGEFLRKFTCRRLLAVEQPEILAATVDMRQYGCGAAGGMEAIIHFRKCVRALWRRGKLLSHLCIIDIDQENFFGSLDWAAIRKEVTAVCPHRGAALAWKHAEPVKVHVEGAAPHPSNRGAGQGDVDAPMEASMTQGAIARDARMDLYAHLRQESSGDGPDSDLHNAIEGFEGQATA